MSKLLKPQEFNQTNSFHIKRKKKREQQLPYERSAYSTHACCKEAEWPAMDKGVDGVDP
jgi:hypothetical protein